MCVGWVGFVNVTTLDWTDLDRRAVDTVRALAMDAVQKAGNGHPGTAMSLAPAAYLLFQRVMRHDPSDPHWPGRDRFVLSAGHSSLTLYIQLYMSGYGLELTDLADSIAATIKNSLAATGAQKDQLDLLIARVLMLLDPRAPIRFRDFCVHIEGFGTALAAAMLSKEKLQPFTDFINKELWRHWLGAQTISDEDVRRAVEAVHANRFIARLPQGLATPVAERGATLSMGEKQLLSFARALAFDPAVLILDEATSSVDTETEVMIREALAVLMRGRTTIAIAHRLSTIQDMDEIIVLHKGELRERGSHAELLARKGIYHRLFQLQFQAGGAAPRPTEDAAACPP